VGARVRFRSELAAMAHPRLIPMHTPVTIRSHFFVFARTISLFAAPLRKR